MYPLLRGTLAGGFVLFVWNMVANMLPFHQAPIRALRSDGPMIDALSGLGAEPGTYFLNRLPGQLGVGPGYWGWMTIHRSSDYAFVPSLVRALVAQLVIALCLSWVLRTHGSPEIARRWASIMVLAVAALLAGAFTFWNWSWFSAGYAATQAFDLLVGWALAGLAIAWLVPPAIAP